MIISSISYKGGVGKTTIAQNLAVGFAMQGVKVCIIDADHSTKSSLRWSGVRSENPRLSDVLVVSQTDPKALAGNVKQLYNNYDVIIIDSPPSDTPISVKIMLLSSLILMPIKPTGRAEIWTATDLLERYENAFLGRDEPVPAYFVVNDCETNTTLHKSVIQVIDELANDYPSVSRLKTVIHHRVAYGEAGVEGKGVLEHNNPKAKAEVEQLLREVHTIAQTL